MPSRRSAATTPDEPPVAGPNWADDDPAEAPIIAANCAALLNDLAAAAAHRQTPTLADARQWHQRIYEGCTPPAACYVGNFRGDARYPELVDYEVGIGAPMPDGLPEKVGVWARDLRPLLDDCEQRLAHALTVLDGALPLGRRPSTVDELHAVVGLAAQVHGEWVRLALNSSAYDTSCVERVRRRERRRRASAAATPHMPWTPPPGGVDEEQSHRRGFGVA